MTPQFSICINDLVILYYSLFILGYSYNHITQSDKNIVYKRMEHQIPLYLKISLN